MIDESSYGTGEFTIHLKSSDWCAYHEPQNATINAKSSLLHEYIHYLQDTATYYGTIYRKQIYEDNEFSTFLYTGKCKMFGLIEIIPGYAS